MKTEMYVRGAGILIFDSGVSCGDVEDGISFRAWNSYGGVIHNDDIKLLIQFLQNHLEKVNSRNNCKLREFCLRVKDFTSTDLWEDKYRNTRDKEIARQLKK